MFRVEVLSSTPNPQQTIYAAMHTDYSESFVYDETLPSESESGSICVRRLLRGERGHYGPLEHAMIVFNVGWFPHSVMQQARTHRVGCCLSGDTVVEFGHPSTGSEGETYYRSTISHLAELWHNGRSHQQTESDALYMQKQIGSRNLLHLNEETGFVQHTRISNIYDNGPKEVWLITLEDGKSIKATKDHRVLTPTGWSTFGQLSEGSEILTASSSGSFLAPMETDMTNEQTEDWKPCAGLSHRVTTRKKGVACKIASIVPAGIENTYDLEVIGPFHNFIANGIVVHNSFDVQSMRYTGERIVRAANNELDIESVFYLRPVGTYHDRQGKKYDYSAAQRAVDLDVCRTAAQRYRDMIEAGFAEEHARGILPFDYRQHFVVSFSLRAALHFLDLRAKADAQLEIKQLCDLMVPHIEAWAPEITGWYMSTRYGRARLAP